MSIEERVVALRAVRAAGRNVGASSIVHRLEVEHFQPLALSRLLHRGKAFALLCVALASGAVGSGVAACIKDPAWSMRLLQGPRGRPRRVRRRACRVASAGSAEHKKQAGATRSSSC
eukprot:scaffold12204_cov61-Phaeocystis_antarctica.AAC.6